VESNASIEDFSNLRYNINFRYRLPRKMCPEGLYDSI
jgi:hypothetical protein